MSQKDKNTIVIAAIALLIFGIAFLGIKPAVTSISETKTQNATLSATKETMKAEIDSLDTYKQDLQTAKANYLKVTEKMYGSLTSDKIHDEAVALVNSCGLEITSLTITDVSKQSISTYSIADGQGIGGSAEGGVTIANVAVGVSGTPANIISLIDAINADEGTYLQQASVPDSADTSAVTISFAMVLSDTF